MGKYKKKNQSSAFKNAPLDEQISGNSKKPYQRIKTRDRQEDETYIDDKLSKKILDEARKQQEEIDDEEGLSTFNLSDSSKPKTSLNLSSQQDSDDDDDLPEPPDQEYYEDIEIDDKDEAALNVFMNKNPPARRTLADIIMEKITEKQTEIQTQFSDAGSLQVNNLDPRIVGMYKSIQEILSKYRSGKMPKAFKIIPMLSNWEQILYLTNPEGWSAAAVYQATRIFASNLKDKMAQRFYNLVLLPRIRDDISEFKRLNFHLYEALRKSLFKPGAFFKGILIPLCESGTCTLRETIIVGSVLAKNSIPVLHSSACILRIAEMDYNGANSIFLRILLDKKYALPYRVIDAVVNHFLRFQGDKRQLPVLWHQAFLTLVQRYKEDISSEQKEALLDVLKVHSHHQITAEIRRELQNSKCRDEEMAM